MNTCKHLLLRSILTLFCFLFLLASCQQEESAGTSGILVDVPLHITLGGVQDYTPDLGDASFVATRATTTTPMKEGVRFRVLALQNNQMKGQADYTVTAAGVSADGPAMQLSLGKYQFIAYSLNTGVPLPAFGDGILKVTNETDLVVAEEFRDVGYEPVSLLLTFVPQRAKIQVKLDGSALKANILLPGKVELSDATFYTGASFAILGGSFFDFTDGKSDPRTVNFTLPATPGTTLTSDPIYVLPTTSTPTVTITEAKIQGFLPFSGKGTFPSFLPGREYVYTLAMSMRKYIPLHGANSFIVTDANEYAIDASIKGNGKQVKNIATSGVSADVPASTADVNITGGVSAEVMWETFNTLTAPNAGDVVYNVKYDSAKKRITFATTANEGNAVIALKNKDNKILWSWHIWRSNSTPSSLQLNPIADVSETLVLMDRNLGALSSDAGALSLGLHYQWGRKDPIPAFAALGGGGMATVPGGKPGKVTTQLSIDESIQNPAAFIAFSGDWCRDPNDNLWGAPITAGLNNGSKTIYDPCPPGWRVPPIHAFTNAVSSSGTFANGYSFNIFTSGSGWFPCASSRIYGSGDLVMGPSGRYWVASASAGKLSRHFYFDAAAVRLTNLPPRADGLSCRCMQE